MSNWEGFLFAADQFLVSYSCPPDLTPVKLFEIGHTVELYLKTANTKLTGDIIRAINFSHRLKDIFDDCKSLDPNFMPNYEIKTSIYDSDFIKNNGTKLPPIDQPHYFDNQELYVITKHLMDINTWVPL